MIIIVYAIVLGVYFICPKYMKLVMLLINVFLPDKIPVIDELLMIAGLFVSNNS